MTEVQIRDARPSDQGAIRDATLAAYEEYATQLVPDLWEAYRQNILATLADVKPADQIVAEQGGAILGAVLLYPAGVTGSVPGQAPVKADWPEVRLLAVPPAGRGRGVGSALMQACIGRARRSGASALTLHTTDMMESAVRLYERMGFVRAPELDFHPAPGLTVKGYRLSLDGSAQ